MTREEQDVDQPTVVTISADGGLDGATRRYEKTIGDMAGVYRDEDAWRAEVDRLGPDTVVYSVNEQKYQAAPGALIVGTSTVLPGRVGDEFALTRGHLHAQADRAELYHCLSGTGVMVLETLDGRTEAVELTPGRAVNVPGHWAHRSVNVGDVPFVTVFCYAADAGQDYGIIQEAGGMKSLVVTGTDQGWAVRPNPDHVGYRERELG